LPGELDSVAGELVGLPERTPHGVQHGELARAGELQGAESGPEGGLLAFLQVDLGDVQAAGPQLRRAQVGQHDHPRVVRASRPGLREQRQRLVTGHQRLVEVARQPGQGGPAGREQQGVSASPGLLQRPLSSLGGPQMDTGHVGGVAEEPVGGGQQGKLRFGLEHAGRELPEQLVDGADVGLQDEVQPMLGHEVGRAAPVLGQQRLADGVHRQPVLGVPARGAAVQLGDLGWRLAPQLDA
jgi:hypothetical protein